MSTKKILSRHTCVEGVNRGLCVVTVDEKGNVTKIEPFGKEEAGVVYTDKNLEIIKYKDSLFLMNPEEILGSHRKPI